MKQKTTENNLIKTIPFSLFDKVNFKCTWQFSYIGGLFYMLISITSEVHCELLMSSKDF